LMPVKRGSLVFPLTPSVYTLRPSDVDGCYFAKDAFLA